MTLQKIKEEKRKIENAIKAIELYLEKAIEGTIWYSKQGKKMHFYRVVILQDGTKEKTYLGKDKENIIRKLAKKRYYEKLYPVLKDELKILILEGKRYHPEKKLQVYDDLRELKQFVKPLFESEIDEEKSRVQAIVDRWRNARNTTYDAHPENLKYKTNKGDIVRSKAEFILASIFDLYSEYIEYRYEPEVYLETTGTWYHPDFEIINLRTGEIFYWEHVGGIGLDGYATSFVAKLKTYAANGIVPGKNLILTFEADYESIDTDLIHRYIHEYFGCPIKVA